MTDSLFFDSDCISAFLWVGDENLLVKLYPGRIVIPKPVYDELSYPGIAHLKTRVDALLSAGQAQIKVIETDTETYSLYYQLTVAPLNGHVIIGKGEAASIALAKASNKNAELRILFEELNNDHSRRLYNLTKYQVERKRRRGIWSRVKKDFKKETISIILSGIISMTKQCRNKGVGYRD